MSASPRTMRTPEGGPRCTPALASGVQVTDSPRAKRAQGSEEERLLAAQRASALLAKDPQRVAELLTDASTDVQRAARDSVRHHFLWKVRRMSDDAKVLRALSVLELEPIRQAAAYGLAMVVRDARFARLVAQAARSDLGPAVRALLDTWQSTPPTRYERIGIYAFGALAVYAELGEWAEIVPLARKTLASCSNARPEDEPDIRRVEDLLGLACTHLGGAALRAGAVPGGRVPIAACMPGQRVTVEGTVASLEEMRSVRKGGKRLAVRDGGLEDESGRIGFSLWEDDIDGVEPGDRLRFRDARVDTHRDLQKQLSRGKDGQLVRL
jgi:hypothetical protein